MSQRKAEVKRQTKETKIALSLFLDGGGDSSVDTGLPFLDHMLDLFARHGLFDLRLSCKGDLEVDKHHTVEDCGLALGQAVKAALGDKAGIARMGSAWVPMGDALAWVVLDICGRPQLCIQELIDPGDVGEPPVELPWSLVEEWFRSVVSEAGITLHLGVRSGTDGHHIIEALFKAFGRALDAAVRLDPRVSGVPSTKGSL